MGLLGLPPELRNLIYIYALSEEINRPHSMFDDNSPFGFPAVLKVNRQIEDEVVGLYFGVAQFEIKLWANRTSDLLYRLKHLQHEHPKAAKYLLVNDNVNVRILFDKQTQDFELLECLLSKYALRLDRPRWWFAAEHYQLHHRPRDRSVDLDRARNGQDPEFFMQDEEWRFEHETDAIGLLRPELKRIMDTIWRMFLTVMERAESAEEGQLRTTVQ